MSCLTQGALLQGIDMSTPSPTEESRPDNPAYPSAMEQIEKKLLLVRRKGKDLSALPSQQNVLEDAVGIGLSGGGIRSATFCLGLFQGLVKQMLRPEDRRKDRTSLLSKIDYMST